MSEFQTYHCPNTWAKKKDVLNYPFQLRLQGGFINRRQISRKQMVNLINLWKLVFEKAIP